LWEKLELVFLFLLAAVMLLVAGLNSACVGLLFLFATIVLWESSWRIVVYPLVRSAVRRVMGRRSCSVCRLLGVVALFAGNHWVEATLLRVREGAAGLGVAGAIVAIIKVVFGVDVARFAVAIAGAFGGNFILGAAIAGSGPRAALSRAVVDVERHDLFSFFSLSAQAQRPLKDLAWAAI
jgi:hypothetical protein